MAEPWANPKCTDMLSYVLAKGFKVAIYTTLHGMSSEDADNVIELIGRHVNQVEVICLHLPDANGNMRGWKPSLEWETVFRKILVLAVKKAIPCFEIMTMDGSANVCTRP